MLPTPFWGVLTFLIVLGPLVIIHELGHLLAARRVGVKVLEFGFGFPPRAAGIWTGNTEVDLTKNTRFTVVGGRETLAVGAKVSIAASRMPNGRLEAKLVRPHLGSKQDTATFPEAHSLVIGKVRALNDDRMTVAEMLWSFNWLPIGGFVRMVGEEDPSAEGSLAGKSRAERAFVITAGALMNAIIPFTIFPLMMMLPQQRIVGDVVISAVMPGSPAEMAGIRAGDKIKAVDGRSITSVGELQEAVTLRLGAESLWEVEQSIPDPRPGPGGSAFQYTGVVEHLNLVPRWKPPQRNVVSRVIDPSTQVSLRAVRPFDITVGVSDFVEVVRAAKDTLHEISLLDAQELDPLIKPGDVLRVVNQVENTRTDISLMDARRHDSRLGLRTTFQEGAVGITIGMDGIREETLMIPPWIAIPKGWGRVIDIAVLTKNAIFGNLIGSTNPQFSGPVTLGPVGIGQLTGEVAVSDVALTSKIATLVNLVGLLSMSLAVINIMPIPALDGGRLLFVLIEWARRGKRISPDREGLVHVVGFVVLLSFIAFVSAQDIARIMRGESFF